MTVDVDVSVVAYQSRDLLPACLDALEGVGGGGMRVVVDHGRDGSAAVARERGWTTVERPDNPGFGTGHNGAVALGSARWLLLVNPDAVVAARPLAAGIAAAGSDPAVGAVQGVVVGADGRPERSAGRALRPLHLWGRALGARRLLGHAPVRSLARRVPALADSVERAVPAPTEVESLAATVLAVRREAFEQVGGFDERYFLYGEDLDLCRRLREAGWTLQARPEVWAHHQSGASSSSWAERERHWWRGTLTYAAAWWSPAAVAAGYPAAVAMWVRLAAARPARAAGAARDLLVAPWREGIRIRRSRASAAGPPGPTRWSRRRP